MILKVTVKVQSTVNVENKMKKRARRTLLPQVKKARFQSSSGRKFYFHLRYFDHLQIKTESLIFITGKQELGRLTSGQFFYGGLCCKIPALKKFTQPIKLDSYLSFLKTTRRNSDYHSLSYFSSRIFLQGRIYFLCS